MLPPRNVTSGHVLRCPSSETIGLTFLSLRLALLMSVPENFRPSIGLVLGSGLGSFIEEIEVRFTTPYAELDGMPVSTVSGHSGQLVGATVSGTTWALLNGRVHLYEGRPATEITSGIRFLKSLGCHTVILTNAAGTLHPDHPPGSWMQITDHLNLTGTSPLLGGPNFVDMTEVYDRSLVETFARLASELRMPLHQGVYAGLLGPQYETPAEIRMLRGLGADAVGMSTVLEAIQARALGMRVVGFSCLTNWAAGLNAGPLHHTEVLETGFKSAQQLCNLLGRWKPDQ